MSAHNDLDRWLANRFEPEPSVPTENIFVAPDSYKSSPGGWWRLVDVWGEPHYVWQPVRIKDSWSGAGRVIEAMVARGWTLHLEVFNSEGQAIFVAWFARNGRSDIQPKQVNDTDGPWAIALAAKAALEDEDA